MKQVAEAVPNQNLATGDTHVKKKVKSGEYRDKLCYIGIKLIKDETTEQEPNY